MLDNLTFDTCATNMIIGESSPNFEDNIFAFKIIRAIFLLLIVIIKLKIKFNKFFAVKGKIF